MYYGRRGNVTISLARGKVTVSNGTVVLQYDRGYPSRGSQSRVEETLHVTPNGLE